MNNKTLHKTLDTATKKKKGRATHRPSRSQHAQAGKKRLKSISGSESFFWGRQKEEVCSPKKRTLTARVLACFRKRSATLASLRSSVAGSYSTAIGRYCASITNGAGTCKAGSKAGSTAISKEASKAASKGVVQHCHWQILRRVSRMEPEPAWMRTPSTSACGLEILVYEALSC